MEIYIVYCEYSDYDLHKIWYIKAYSKKEKARLKVKELNQILYDLVKKHFPEKIKGSYMPELNFEDRTLIEREMRNFDEQFEYYDGIKYGCMELEYE